ncbi:WD repeat-containing and planar cell polarity effector protein fritz homolog isoform X1 [Leptonychotes weddellii]|uniref:WD repeat-containing and planar cell polarity effector protein fritz homolog isoform X1 n=1 Tax=Leptonychotes weddellii TaxID=9713 RepID=A0A7F8QSA5_LEPWE|nr:WD repeat-containing and planar cell polarity effector protein fritz homolog isoform X1 [Leptonychotes weddellii]XP_030884063.1 WD repeat-containing and planar cell polarity effector protein fritz homolog isoform X1 [Leptonychotes weddellii]XP_030884064.1 WD repeat-containing and planar cell polarity effector protein fritz homolog isoform X1 [Leptonychotes weddellii]XP_030884065.1 WD repeat-containing and planar cell polarity effector protein fritz homolog isoform X1 [Leptonychotes weddellii]
MSFCLTELHLWSLKNTLHIGDRDIGIYQYYDKKDPPVSVTEHGNLEEKQKLAESRDYPWTLKNRRPEKLRDSLKELEELMQNSHCVLSKWKNKYVCQLLFGSGVLVSLSLSGPQLEKVVIDRSLVGKLISDSISDALLTDNFIILSFLTQNKLCFIQFTKKMGSPDTNKRLEKLSALDYKISYYEIPGPVNRTTECRLAINCVQDIVACWWPLVSDDAWPWAPISPEKDRANLLLLGYAQGRLEVLSCVRTEWDPLDIRFGTKQPYQVLTVERSISVDKESMADSCIYEYVRNKIQCISVTRIPLRSKAISCCRNVTEDKLILGCEDSSVILYETHRRVTLLAQAELLPSLISCHPSGAILLVGSNQGELQIFDMALSPINIQLLAEDRSPREILQFNKFFDISSSLVQMQWIAPQVVSQKPECGDIYDLLFLRFDRGPLGALLFKLGIFTRGQLGLTDTIFHHIHCDEIYEAINILSSMNWDTLGHQCFISMSAIVNHLLRQKLTPEREAQLEASLGTFYAPTRPLLDTTILEYRDEISKYARRFFHHLLRYQRFEKAFLLAVDIGARDLFMDIHYFALDKGELALAEVARKRASDIDAESITSGVELLGPLDRGDMLNEAFVGLSLVPQGEDTFPDNLPPFCSIHKHIIQQRTLNVSSNRQVLDGRNELEKDTCAESLTPKTCNKEGVNAKFEVTGELASMNSLCKTTSGKMREDCIEQEIGDGGSLRMVHFGLV